MRLHINRLMLEHYTLFMTMWRDALWPRRCERPSARKGMQKIVGCGPGSPPPTTIGTANQENCQLSDCGRDRTIRTLEGRDSRPMLAGQWPYARAGPHVAAAIFTWCACSCLGLVLAA